MEFISYKDKSMDTEDDRYMRIFKKSNLKEEEIKNYYVLKDRDNSKIKVYVRSTR